MSFFDDDSIYDSFPMKAALGLYTLNKGSADDNDFSDEPINEEDDESDAG